MKIICDRLHPKDNEYIPSVGEKVMTPNEYVVDYIKRNSLVNMKVMRNVIWLDLFKSGIDLDNIEFALLNNDL